MNRHSRYGTVVSLSCCEGVDVLGVLAPRSDADPALVERYEYTPYGQRSVYSRDWLAGDIKGNMAVDTDDYWYWDFYLGEPAAEGDRWDTNGDGNVDTDDSFAIDMQLGLALTQQADPLMAPRINSCGGINALDGGAITPLGLCPFGHQGLFEDREFGGQLYNRMRQNQPPFMRWPQPDTDQHGDAGLGEAGRSPAHGSAQQSAFQDGADEAGGPQYHDGINLYQYCRSQSLLMTDPLGRMGVIPPALPGILSELNRRTDLWHIRGYGISPIDSIAGEQEHTVISFGRSVSDGVDFGPANKKGSFFTLAGELRP